MWCHRNWFYVYFLIFAYFVGHTYRTLEKLLEAIKGGEIPTFTPAMIEARNRERSERLLQEGRQERRRLEEEHRRLQPQPFPGAAGTAGPLPSRTKRRGGLEYRAHPEHVEAQGKRFQVKASSDDEGKRIKRAERNHPIVPFFSILWWDCML